jgi:hypothetical protein
LKKNPILFSTIAISDLSLKPYQPRFSSQNQGYSGKQNEKITIKGQNRNKMVTI